MKVELKVEKAMQDDVGKGIVRIDTRTREILGVAAGDIVEIIGKRATAAIVLHAYDEDEGLGIIRMDGILRQNAKVAWGEKVKVRKAKAEDAEKVILSLLHHVRFSPGFGEFIKRKLLGRPVVKGDKIGVSVLGTMIPFKVVQTIPEGIVTIEGFTEVIVRRGKYTKEALFMFLEEIRKDIKEIKKFLFKLENRIASIEYEMRDLRDKMKSIEKK